MKGDEVKHSEILRRAWEITRRHRALWVFGFLLALFSGGGGAGSGQGAQYTMGGGRHVDPALLLMIAGAVLLFVVFMILLSIVLTYTSRGALIGMVREVEETTETSARSGWRIGWSRFLRLFAIDLVIGVPAVITAIVLLALGLSPLLLLIAEQRALTIVAIVLTVMLMLLLIGLLIVMGVGLTVLGQLAHRQCVLEGKGVGDSIQDAYRMGRQNLKDVGVVWLLLLAVDIGVGIVLAPIAVVVFGAAAVSGFFTYLATDGVAPTLVVSIPAMLLAVLIMTALGAIHQVFRSAAWTLAYREL
jgi:hypothetical protein